MISKTEEILQKLHALLEQNCNARVERNETDPERIPKSGLIVIHDGELDEPEYTLGGFEDTYYNHYIEIDLFIQEGKQKKRDEAFDALYMEVDAVLQNYPTLDSLVDGRRYARPESETLPIDGAAAIKTATLILEVNYHTDTPLG